MVPGGHQQPIVTVVKTWDLVLTWHVPALGITYITVCNYFINVFISIITKAENTVGRT